MAPLPIVLLLYSILAEMSTCLVYQYRMVINKAIKPVNDIAMIMKLKIKPIQN
jgi:hypothetical protein